MWSVLTDVPNTAGWLSISSSGTLSGTPGTAETETVVIRVTDNAGAIAQGTFSLVVQSGGTLPAPSKVMIILQGQDKQGDNSRNAHDSYTPTQPNHQSVGFQSVPGATSYDFYKSTTTVAGTNGPYIFVTNVAASTLAANYAAYIANSTWMTTWNATGSHNIAPGIDSVWTDTGATGCCSGAEGPTGGFFYSPATGYTYTVVARNGSVTSAQSAPSILPLIVNGGPVFIESVFDHISQISWNQANPGGLLTPAGFSNSIFVSLTNPPPGTDTHNVNPFTGGACPTFNCSTIGFNYYNLCIYTTQSWGTSTNGFVYATEIDNDYFLYNPNDTPIPSPPTPNIWNQIKLPLSAFMKVQAGSTCAVSQPSTVNLRQGSLYKTTFSNFQGGTTMAFNMEAFLSVS
jgi:hypothetical protein